VTLSRFVAPGDTGQASPAWPETLDPGRYRVAFRAGSTWWVRHEDRGAAGESPLWDGEVSVPDVFLEVLPPATPTLSLRHLEDSLPGSEARVRVVLANPTPEPVRVDGSFLLHVHDGRYDWTARFGLGAPFDRAPGSRDTVDLAARSMRAVDLDVTALNLTSAGVSGPSKGLYDVATHSILHLVADLVAPDGRSILRSDPVVQWVDQLRPFGPTRVHVRSEGTRVAVSVENASSEPIRIPYPPRVPAELCLSLSAAEGARIESGWFTDPLPESFGHLANGLVWDLTAFDPPAAPDLVRSRVLAPGERVVHVVDLARLLKAPIPAGRYSLVATWANLESGARSGLPRFTTGLASSESIEIEIPSSKTPAEHSR
jgi:hypothetical protein